MADAVARHARAVRGSLRERASDSDLMGGLARAGLVARGVLYLVVAVLAVHVALGRERESPDNHGALQAVARQPLGRVLLVAVAVGFAGYALWRFAQAFLDTDGDGNGAGGLGKRAINVGRGLLYLSFLFVTVRLVAGSHGDDQQGKEADITARVLELSWGRWGVALAGLAVIAVGGTQLYRVVARKYGKKLETRKMGAGTRRGLAAVATIGFTARGTVFVLIGAFLVKAAARYDPNEAVGVDGALKRLAARAHGPWLLAAVALGLLGYAVYCFIEARYRRVLES